MYEEEEEAAAAAISIAINEPTDCKMSRAPTWRCTDQRTKQICTLLSAVNTIAHNICTELGWTSPDNQINTSFNLTTNCQNECIDTSSALCKCCLLRIYIKTIILTEFPYMIKKGANMEAVIIFVDLCFNELFISDNLYETIKEHLSGYGGEELVRNLVDIFQEIPGPISFYKFHIKKGILHPDQSNLENWLKEDLYAIMDEHNIPLFDFVEKNIIDPSLLGPYLSDPYLIQSILCGDDQMEIDSFMTAYLTTMPNLNNIFHLLEAQVQIATQEEIDKYLPMGHAIVLKCIFWYNGKKWAYLKNSWGIKIGFNGHHIVPIDALLDCRIYIPKIRELTEDELREKKYIIKK